MPRMIVKNGSANPLTYTLGQSESLAIEALSADIDTTGVVSGNESYCDAIYTDQAGFLIARSRSSVTVPAAGIVTMTFAPWLPDTYELGNELVGFVNTTGLCATALPPGASAAVQVSEAQAVVTQIRLWVEDAVDAAGTLEAELAEFGAWAYVPGPGA